MKTCKPICRPGPLSYNEYYTMKYHCRQNLPPCKPPSWYSSCPQPCPQPCLQPCPQPCPQPCLQPCCPSEPCNLCPCETPNTHKKDIMA